MNDDLLKHSNNDLARELAELLRLPVEDGLVHTARNGTLRPVTWLLTGDGAFTVLDIMELAGWTYIISPLPGTTLVVGCSFVRPDEPFDKNRLAMHPHRGRAVAQAAVLTLRHRPLLLPSLEGVVPRDGTAEGRDDSGDAVH